MRLPHLTVLNKAQIHYGRIKERYRPVSMKKKIVGVVENDPNLLKALDRLLTAHGFTVDSYCSAEAFLDGATASEMSCLVLDIHLGGMSGIQLRRHLAASGFAVPIIVMTARDGQSSHQETTPADCVTLLLKPFPAASLLDAIDKAVSK
jgi:FixJ family two-component response regulator